MAQTELLERIKKLFKSKLVEDAVLAIHLSDKLSKEEFLELYRVDGITPVNIRVDTGYFIAFSKWGISYHITPTPHVMCTYINKGDYKDINLPRWIYIEEFKTNENDTDI